MTTSIYTCVAMYFKQFETDNILHIVYIEEYGKIYIECRINFLWKNIWNTVTFYNSLTSKLYLSNWLGYVFTSDTHTSQIQSLQGYTFVVLQ
jgi:hypothetical protein